MLSRNWLDLSRKLVSRIDMNYSFTAVQQALGEYALAWFGEGVVNTSQYPNPFQFTMSGSVLGGSVSNGIAFDENGQLTNITNTTLGSKSFTLAPADPSNARFDLVCIKYNSTGDTPVPKPSDPLSTIFLNLHDDFELIVIEGTPSGSPVYPPKGNPLYIVLAGIHVPISATLGTQCTVDYSQREQANSNLTQFPVFVQEVPAGVVNGVNSSFALSEQPLNGQSVIVTVDGLSLVVGQDWSIIGQVITLSPAPAIGSDIEVFYIANKASSQNPLAGVQEVPGGTPNGSTTQFSLAGTPASQTSTLVYLDGLQVASSEWSLIQGPTCYIDFTGSTVPQPGQSLYVFYFTNPFIFGTPPPSPPPAGVGALVTQGSGASPVTINPASGLSATSDQRQAWYIKSPGGSQTVTSVPQISAGMVVGQEMVLFGGSDTDYLIFTNGNGLSLNGPIDLTTNGALFLVWNGTVWVELSRR